MSVCVSVYIELERKEAQTQTTALQTKRADSYMYVCVYV